MRPLLVVAFATLVACGPETAAPPREIAPPPVSSTPPEKPVERITEPVLPYPKTRRDAIKDVLFGVTVEDPYRWLEDGKAPEVQAWMKGEDDLARSELQKLPERDALAARFKELYYVDAVGAPRHRGDRYFLGRRHAKKEKGVVYWKQGKTGAEQVLLDPNTWSADGSSSLGNWSPSWDGKLVAYTVHKNNSDDATLYVMDVASGNKSAIDTIEGARYASASWTPKDDGFYYIWLDPDPAISDAERPGHSVLRFHKLGDSPKNDQVLHEKTGDASKFLGGYLSIDGHWLFCTVSSGWTSDDVYFMDMRAKKSEWHPLVVGRKAHFSVEAYKDRFYVTTDDEAPRSRVYSVDPKKPDRASWKEIIPEHPHAKIDSAGIVGGRLGVVWMDKAVNKLSVYELSGKLVKDIQLPGLGTAYGFYGRADEDEGYYSFESFTTSPETYAISMKTLESKLYTKIQVPVDATPYTVDQEMYKSKDGTEVSMFIVHRKDFKKDGTARAVLYGYGGFGLSEQSTFTTSIFPWLERGGIYAVANLRGGSEYGEEWHTNGMLLKKQNVFDDFIAAAEHLVKAGYTKSDRLAISGGSNGGLLVGAAVTQRPDLFSAVLCQVPLLDMIRYHRFGAGKTWTEEYGSAENEAQFKALFAYSPYHHIKTDTAYPPLLMLSADSDDRVDPMHARKFSAALQAVSKQPVLLRIERNSGHGGADLVKAAVEKSADTWAFALAHTAH